MKKLFYISMLIAFAVGFGTPASAAQDRNVSGDYCSIQNFTVPRDMNPDGTCPPDTYKPEDVAVNTCLLKRTHMQNLSLRQKDDGSIDFNINAMFPNKHTCEMTGNAVKSERGWHHTSNNEGTDCTLEILIDEAGSVTFEDNDGMCSRIYCGANAYLPYLGFAADQKKDSCDKILP